MLSCQVFPSMIVFQFLYVNQSFSPSPDTEIGSLFDVSNAVWCGHASDFGHLPLLEGWCSFLMIHPLLCVCVPSVHRLHANLWIY